MRKKKLDKIFKHLKTLALSNDGFKNYKLAACIEYRNDIIAYGFNQTKTHPFQAKFAKHQEAIYLHAEVHAIYNALKKLPVEELSKCTLYVMRVNKEGEALISCPCKGCQMAINTFNIKHVYFTENNSVEFKKK